MRNMKKVFLASSVALMLLTACQNSDSSQQENQKKTSQADNKKDEKHTSKHQTENNEKQNKTSGQQHSDKEDKGQTKSSAGQLSDKTKLALIFYANPKGKYSLTKNEILTGKYKRQGTGDNDVKQIVDFGLVPYENISQAPDGMKFYMVYPDKGSYRTVVGVNNDKIYIGATQSPIRNYQDALKSGDEYDLNKVYTENKNNRSLPEMENKIKITQKDPRMDESDTERKQRELKESGTEMAHARSQLFDQIAQLEGAPANKDYLWDNIKMTKDSWSINYRNQDGEILGTYKLQGKKMIKEDQNGNQVKSAPIKNDSAS